MSAQPCSYRQREPVIGRDIWLTPRRRTARAQSPAACGGLNPDSVNFVVFGILLALSAVGWYRVLTPLRGAIWFPLLQGISGLCLMGAGVFSMDPFPGYPPGVAQPTSTVHGTLHSSFAWVLILSLALGCSTMGISLMRLSRWRGWAVYSYLTGMLILVFGGVRTRCERAACRTG